jgi:hypothetical protein
MTLERMLHERNVVMAAGGLAAMRDVALNT